MKPHNLFFIVFCVFSLWACQSKKENQLNLTQNYKFKNDTLLQFLKNEDTLEQVFNIELAKSNFQKETGLMHRKEMQENQGMLFLYEAEAPRPSFYMKNTYIALDLIYFDKSFKIVDFNLDTTPLSESLISSTVPSQYVLEVNSGVVKKLGLKLGDKALLK
ncbi:DUF192 domain-containing protein [Psychroflexus tropicus]|uniref:DUF192 domain-containing protein n=1 Tax=Psychroflexus tropicus TaxID=197345 RepID=UPI000375FA22|nr:DUF192 domain-containing protein [Psychroflexus tropicus]